jgi:hypothetical protein
MKKKRTAQFAFFNLRVLIGLFIIVAGVSLALLGSGASSPSGSSSAKAQQKYQPPIKVIDPTLLPPGFDCSQIHQLGIDRQENFHAGLIMIACGAAEGGSVPNVSFLSRLWQRLFAPLVYGDTDVDLITGAETSPHVTQSETFSWANPDNPNQIVVTYNDSRTASANYSGASYSSDGGTTFTRLDPSPFASGHGTNFGDPVVLYNRPDATWHAIWLATGCGGQGIGDWTSTDGGVTWAVGACVANLPSGGGDRESGWSDMNPSSPFYGRMYVSFNNFALSGPPISVTFSSDNGATWSAPQNLPLGGASFVRNVQITGDQVTGDVYIAGMNEMGGGLGNRANMIYRSTDGGATWVLTYTQPAFGGPGSGLCSNNSYFASMFGTYWRHMGWGEPAAYNHLVHYVYAQHGAGADPGDIYYIRSTDSGATFSSPLRLNTDATTTAQWQPNLSVNSNGSLFAMWYDGREGTGCTPGVNTPCYRMWGRKSTDNGVTWQADMAYSDVVSPLPGQPDPNVADCYAGDYDYGSAITSKHVSSWVDGRVLIGGTSQQDAFTDREIAGPSPTASPAPTATATASPTPTPTPTPTPCVVGYMITQIVDTIVPGTTDTGNHGDDVITNVVLPFTFTLYDTAYTSVNVSDNGNAQFTTMDSTPINVCLPWHNRNYTVFPYWDDLRTDNLGWAGCMGYPNGLCGIFTSVSGTAPNRVFNIEWRAVYVGNTALKANHELSFYEGQSRFDVIYGTVGNGNTSATAGVQKNDTTFTQYFCNGTGGAATGGQAYTVLPCGTPSPTPTATATPTATPTTTPIACSLFENFDNVTPPTLPPGWTAINAIDPDGILWQTSNSGNPTPPAYSPPNAVWVNDPPVVSDKRLDSPPIAIDTLESAALTFRNNYALQNTFDGGVLELSIDGGAFQDIIAAGGSFLEGGYDGTISTCCGNPLAGRQAWTGSSGGFITTTVDMVGFQGHTIVLQWRMGSDSSSSGQGWRIDNVQMICERPTPTATPTPSATVFPTPTASPTPSEPSMTPSPTPSATFTPTSTPTTTPPPTPTATPTLTATPRVTPTPRLRPTPAPRP